MIISIQPTPDCLEFPYYYPLDSSGFDLKAYSFKKLFKGNKEEDFKTSSKFDNAIKQGRLLLRPFERIIVGTGLIFTIPQGLKLDVVSNYGLVYKRGLAVLNPPIDYTYTGELDILLYNSSQFLNEVNIGMVVAKGIFSTYELISFEANVSPENILDAYTQSGVVYEKR